ncbi:TonB-dependent receptor [uncultured Zobellia sp.]|uniref:SusC/RagA family TonB-linked outer membrane protein n=1 Tax=uncultured Zobellia sp. TaxID=255433 RepID=UPI0025958FA1|nr:TonB-dependent receptor [uncultured Zobellia sp.]
MKHKKQSTKKPLLLRLGLSFLGLLLATMQLHAQDDTISGTVSDDTGMPLPGANVLVKGTTTGTQTDFDGNYIISAPNDATLVFSYIGFSTQEVPVNGESTLNVTLSEDASKLDEVVVVGYGQQKRVNLTGSVTAVDEEALEDRNVQNAFQALQGQAAGLQISQGTGAPGNEKLNIKIRGLNSFGSSNSPLVLINGVEGNLQDLDPTVISSISVLKDASSAAIYGSRAANGVILVTTKTGGANQFKIEYNGSVAIETFTQVPQMISNSADYMELMNTALQNTSGATANPYPQELIDAYRNANGDPAFPNTDWFAEASRTPIVQRHAVTASGSIDDTSYNISIGSWDQPGIIKSTGFEKYNFFMSVKSKIGENLTVGGTVSGVDSKSTGFRGAGDNLFNLFRVRPTWGVYTLDGSGHYAAKAFSGNDSQFPGFDEGFTRNNPIAELEVQDGESLKQTNFNGNLFVDIDLSDNLVWSTKGAYKFDYDFYKFQRMQYDEYNYRTGDYLRTTRDISELTVDNIWTKQTTLFSTLTYSNLFGNHDIKLLGGYSQEGFNRNYTRSIRQGIPNRVITDLAGVSAENQFTSGFSESWAIQSFFGRANYNYKEKYLLEANLRGDISSRFAKGNRLGIFPSVSAGWRLDKESFFENIDEVSELKLRGSWGQLGNQNIGSGPGDELDSGVYPYQSTLAFDGFGYPFSDNVRPGVGLNNLVDQDITWETTTVTDFGLDFSLFDRKFFGSVDYYVKETVDILRELQIDLSSGLNPPVVNLGAMTNKGWDIVIGHQNRINDDFSYSINGNVSWFKNRLKTFGDKEIGERFIDEEGYAYQDWYMWEADGFFQSQEEIDNSPVQPEPGKVGFIKLKDQNGDNVVDGDDRIHIDGRYPAYVYGLNLSANYKNIDLRMFWEGVQGTKNYIARDPFRQDGGTDVAWLTEAWTPENPNSRLPAVYYETAEERRSIRYINSFWLWDSSYFRLKNITLGYSFSDDVLEKTPFNKLRFYLAAENYLTFQKDYPIKVDPEASGVDSYPFRKTISMGVNITF